jgi:hypothetical protein
VSENKPDSFTSAGKQGRMAVDQVLLGVLLVISIISAYAVTKFTDRDQ